MAEININSLGYVVNQVLMDLQQPATPYFERYLHFAIKGYRELNILGLMPTMRTVSLPVNQATRTARLPDDYVDFYRIGVCCNGTFINLVYNSEICLDPNTIPELCCDHDTIQNNISCICNAFNGQNINSTNCGSCNDFGGVWAWPTYLNGFWNYGIVNYGIGKGTYNGGYRINKDAHTIQFDSCVNAQTVTLEYKSNGFNMTTGDFIIPEDAIPALNSYIHYQRCRFSKESMDRRDADRFKSEFITLADDLNHRQEALTKADILDVIRRFTFQAVK